MKLATKYMLIAIGLEIILAIITFFMLSINIYNTIQKVFENLYMFLMAFIPIFIVIFLLGQYVDYNKFSSIFRRFLGVFYLYLFLILYLLSLFFTKENVFCLSDVKFIIDDMLFIIVMTLIFGGIQTLGVGIWLGYKLSCIKN